DGGSVPVAVRTRANNDSAMTLVRAAFMAADSGGRRRRDSTAPRRAEPQRTEIRGQRTETMGRNEALPNVKSPATAVAGLAGLLFSSVLCPLVSVLCPLPSAAVGDAVARLAIDVLMGDLGRQRFEVLLLELALGDRGRV